MAKVNNICDEIEDQQAYIESLIATMYEIDKAPLRVREKYTTTRKELNSQLREAEKELLRLEQLL